MRNYFYYVNHELLYYNIIDAQQENKLDTGDHERERVNNSCFWLKIKTYIDITNQ